MPPLHTSPLHTSSLFYTCTHTHARTHTCTHTRAHTHTHTHILTPFEDSEPTGLKVDTADWPIEWVTDSPTAYPKFRITLWIKLEWGEMNRYMQIYLHTCILSTEWVTRGTLRWWFCEIILLCNTIWGSTHKNSQGMCMKVFLRQRKQGISYEM